MKSAPAVTTRLLLCAVLVLSQVAIAAARPDALNVSNDDLNDHFSADIQPLAQDGDYHIFLRPNGSRFYPQAYGKSPGEFPTRGQFIWVHWIVPLENIADYWADVPEAKFFQPKARAAPADLSRLYRQHRSLDSPNDWVLHDIPLGAFEGGQWIQIRKLYKGQQVGSLIPLYVTRQDWYAWRLGYFFSPLGSDEIVLAPGADEGSKVIEQRDRGRYKGSAVFLVINPWGERDFDVHPAAYRDRVHLLLGTELSDIGETILAGIAYEIAPGCDIIPYGIISGNAKRLAPGYSVGDSFDGEVATLQVERRETERFCGFALSAEFFSNIFNKAGK